MNDTFDFVVVGGGTAGPHLARRLADTSSKPSVLLVEGGPDIRETASAAPYDRFLNANANPHLSYGYSTCPQAHLDNNVLPYARGKGLGGSSAINYGCYVVGADEDFDRWAELVGDKSFGWKEVKERFKRIETFHHESPEGMEQYVNPKLDDHGHDGPVGICLGKVWEEGNKEFMEAARDFGFPLCLDQNSGNPVGFGVTPSTWADGRRTTSATANLKNQPENLTVWTDSKVNRVLVEDKVAKGVEIADGRKVFAKKEVIVTAGSIDTPKILLLSGIGPADELKKHNIPIQHELDGVGKNAQDHSLAFLCAMTKPGFRDEKFKFEKDPESVEVARQQWKKDASGPLALYYSSCNTNWVRDERIYDAPEFKNLNNNLQSYIKNPSVPTYEFVDGCPLFPPGTDVPDNFSYWSMCIMGMCTQSRGSITLASSDPNDPPVIDPGYFSDPNEFDRMVTRTALRRAMEFFTKSTIGKKHFEKWIWAPADESNDEMDKFINKATLPVWHINGSVRMGKKENEDGACVDTRFKVFGVKNLRVGDLSVCPLTPNNHTQSTAYLMGQTAAEKIIEDYDLNNS